jgi:hypothetical protein
MPERPGYGELYAKEMSLVKDRLFGIELVLRSWRQTMLRTWHTDCIVLPTPHAGITLKAQVSLELTAK